MKNSQLLYGSRSREVPPVGLDPRSHLSSAVEAGHQSETTTLKLSGSHMYEKHEKFKSEGLGCCRETWA